MAIETEQQFFPSAPLLSEQKQLRIIPKVDSLKKFSRASEILLGADRYFLPVLESELPRFPFRRVPHAYFQLLGLTAFELNQYGFSSPDGHLFRHDRKGWKKSPFDSKHLLALLSYLGNLNSQTSDIKARWANIFEQEQDHLAAKGVWGLGFEVKDGKADTYDEFDPRQARDEAHNRALTTTPICLPTRQLNEQLAALNFSGDVADSISQQAFNHDILPKVRPILGPLFDTSVFQWQNPRSSYPFVFRPSDFE